jgi:hypothetical protein
MASRDDFERANRRAKDLQAAVPRAVSAHYDRKTGRIVIDLSSKLIVSVSPVSAEIKHPHYCRFCLWESRPIIAREHTNTLGAGRASGDCARTSGRSA